MIVFVFRPIERWPQEQTRHRRHAHFRVNYSRTLVELSSELEKLGARRGYIQADVRESEIRNDGNIRADAKPATPRVIVSAETKHGPLSLPCDTYVDWRDNVRAIALSLEALRNVDRHGVTKRGEQYRGLKQLTAGTGPVNSQEAAQFLAKHTDVSADSILRSSGEFEAAYRIAAKALHPDTAGAYGEDWNHLQVAVAILRERFA
jgi:hypothetical protein